MRHASRRIDDSSRVRQPPGQRADRAGRLHALRAADVRRSLPGRRDQADRRRRRAVGAQAALHRLRQLRDRLPVRRARSLRRSQDHDEVRHVLRPDERRQEADVRDGLSEPGALLRHARADRAAAAAVDAGQHVSVRPSDDHDEGARHGAARADRRAPRTSTSPPRWSEQPRSRAVSLRRSAGPTETAWRSIRSPRSRCNDGRSSRDPRAARSTRGSTRPDARA